MFLQLMRAKLHHARVTSADLNYVGSITIDQHLLEEVKIRPFERVQVLDVENGSRFETYALQGPAGSGVIQVNGAAAHLVTPGDRLIILAYGLVLADDETPWVPQVVLLDDHNRVVKRLSGPDLQREELVPPLHEEAVPLAYG